MIVYFLLDIFSYFEFFQRRKVGMYNEWSQHNLIVCCNSNRIFYISERAVLTWVLWTVLLYNNVLYILCKVCSNLVSGNHRFDNYWRADPQVPHLLIWCFVHCPNFTVIFCFVYIYIYIFNMLKVIYYGIVFVSFISFFV